MPLSRSAFNRIAAGWLMLGCFTLFCSSAIAQQGPFKTTPFNTMRKMDKTPSAPPAGPTSQFPLKSLSSRYTYMTLDYPGAPVNYPLGINNKREIVGYYTDASFANHGYLYKDGKFTALEFPGSASTIAGGINDRGDISGLYTDQQGFQHGYLRTMPEGCECDSNGKPWKCQPEWLSLDFPGAAQTQIPFEFGPGLGTAVAGLNNFRQVAGMYATPDLYSNGFIFTGKKYRAVDNPSASHAPGLGTRLFGINNVGVIVGDYLTQASPLAPPVNYGFLLEGDKYTTVFVPGSELGGFGTQVNSVNDLKMVAGIFTDSSGIAHSLLWFVGQAFTVDYPGSLFSEAHTISDRGDLTGAYTNDPLGAVVHGWVAYPKY